MSTQPEGQEPVGEEPTYTVQIEERLPEGAEASAVLGGFEGATVWQDIATVQVPLRTKRRAVVAKALREAGIRPVPGEPGPKVRVLDEDSAAVIEPEPFQPESEWRIK